MGLRNLSPQEVLAIHGLRIPGAILRRLRDCGIVCQPAVAKAGRGILSGYESGGGVHDLGAYCGYCFADGRRLALQRSLESSISRNGLHSVVIASEFVRIQVLRVLHHLELLVTRHTANDPEAPIHNAVLLRGRGVLEKTAQETSTPEFRDETGSPLELPEMFKDVIVRVIQGACCQGCRHSHSLLQPGELERSGNAEGQKLPSIEEVLADLATSGWMKSALLSALSRDPVDSANDAELLYRLLEAHCQSSLKADQPTSASSETRAVGGLCSKQ
jgi:hypothetical protein